MSLKHANELQEELLNNKSRRQREYEQRAEKALFSNIMIAQSRGETQCGTLDKLSQSTIDKLKALDYVAKHDEYGYIIYWGKDRHKKKGWFS